MKTIKFFTDTETTGLLDTADQILSYATILEEEGGQTILEKEDLVVLKGNVLPNPKALLVNNINPFATSWKNKSITEYHMYEDIKKISESHVDKRLVLIAYNAEFDVKMFRQLFKRFGDDFDKYFPVVWDPLPTARKLIEEGVIKTPEVKASYGGGKTYRTSKLEEVFKALGYDSSQYNAHSALDDTRMLQMAAHGLYFLATGKKLEEMSASPESYKINQVIHVILDNGKIGLTKKNVKVLFNDTDNQKLLVIDDELLKNQGPNASVQYIRYSQIVDELPLDKSAEILDKNHQTHEKIIADTASLLLQKKESKKISKVDFKKIEDLYLKLKSSTNLKETYDSLTSDELDLFNDAEELSFSKENEGFKEKIFGKNYLLLVKELDLDYGIKLKLNPLGYYELFLENKEPVKTEKKTEVQDKILNHLKSVSLDVDAEKSVIKKIPSLKEFSLSKNLKSLKEEFEISQGEVFQANNQLHKEILTDLLFFYKKTIPEYFSDLSLPSFKLDLTKFLKK